MDEQALKQQERKIAKLNLVGQILMGAAYADGERDGRELAVITQVLSRLSGGGAIFEEVLTHLRAFDVAGFDVVATCQRLRLSTPRDRRGLLSLVAKVTDADEIHDLREDAYIKLVAEAIGAQPEEYADLTVDILSIEEIGEAEVLDADLLLSDPER